MKQSTCITELDDDIRALLSNPDLIKLREDNDIIIIPLEESDGKQLFSEYAQDFLMFAREDNPETKIAAYSNGNEEKEEKCSVLIELGRFLIDSGIGPVIIEMIAKYALEKLKSLGKEPNSNSQDEAVRFSLITHGENEKKMIELHYSGSVQGIKEVKSLIETSKND